MRSVAKYFADIRVWYAITGIIISIAAHEAFHILAHMGNIEKISFFPNIFTVVEITTTAPGVLPYEIEEAITYTINIVILLLTIIDIYAISDSRDNRSVKDIVNSTPNIARKSPANIRTRAKKIK